MERDKSNKRAYLGLILVIVGVLLVVSQFNVFPFGLRPILFSWQSLLILLGLFFLLSRGADATGWILIFIGGLFMVPRLFHDIPWGWHGLFWPAVLIGLGAILIVRALGHRRETFGEGPDFIDEMSIFGGGDRVLSTQNFRGGRITAIFGGSKYNMRSAQLAKGRNEIDILTVFGGAKFIIPEDWDVKIEVSAIFGGFSDKRNIRKDIPRDPSRELIIKGIAIFGGGDIVNF